MVNLEIRELLISHTLIGKKKYLSSCSVSYLSPTSYRKDINQQLLLGYLDYIKHQGFEKMYIWICPPSKGNDYIL